MNVVLRLLQHINDDLKPKSMTAVDPDNPEQNVLSSQLQTECLLVDLVRASLQDFPPLIPTTNNKNTPFSVLVLGLSAEECFSYVRASFWSGDAASLVLRWCLKEKLKLSDISFTRHKCPFISVCLLVLNNKPFYDKTV